MKPFNYNESFQQILSIFQQKNIKQCCGNTEAIVLNSQDLYLNLFGGNALGTLPIIKMYSIPWNNCESVKEAYRLIQQWPLLEEPTEALEV